MGSESGAPEVIRPVWRKPEEPWTAGLRKVVFSHKSLPQARMQEAGGAVSLPGPPGPTSNPLSVCPSLCLANCTAQL